MKNHSQTKRYRVDLEQPDATELKRRAAEDAVSDADSFAFSRRPRREKPSGAKGLDHASSMLRTHQTRVRLDSQEGIDGLLIHSNEGGAKLVLSDEILEISLADEVAAIMTEPIKIFHVQAPAPWVEQVRVGKA